MYATGCGEDNEVFITPTYSISRREYEMHCYIQGEINNMVRKERIKRIKKRKERAIKFKNKVNDLLVKIGIIN